MLDTLLCSTRSAALQCGTQMCIWSVSHRSVSHWYRHLSFWGVPCWLTLGNICVLQLALLSLIVYCAPLPLKQTKVSVCLSVSPVHRPMFPLHNKTIFESNRTWGHRRRVVPAALIPDLTLGNLLSSHDNPCWSVVNGRGQWDRQWASRSVRASIVVVEKQ